jgi:lysophospholipase L1-like esterase
MNYVGRSSERHTPITMSKTLADMTPNRLFRSKLKESVLLVLGSLLFAGLLAEGIARFMFPEWAPRTAFITKFWRYDPRYGWSHVPGTSGFFQTFGIDTVVSINQNGFRGPEISYARNNVDKRLVVLGDSFVWGFGVDYQDMFTTQLEKLLANTEVVNLGVSGYSTDQELLLYQEEGRKYRADIVIVVVAANDRPGNDRTVENLVYGKPKFIIRNGKLELINQPVAKTSRLKHTAVWLASRSYVLTQFQRVLYEYSGSHTNSADENEERKGSQIFGLNGAKYEIPPSLQGWRLTLQLLLEMRRLVAADGAEVLIVFGEGIGVPVARDMRELFRSLRIDAMFLDDYLGASDKSLHLPDELHWNPAGNMIVAAAVANRIKQKFSNNGYKD